MKLELHHRGELLRQLNNIASPIQEIRDSFALMPRVTEQDFDAIASRMSRIPAALAGYRESLAEAASAGDVASHRQIDTVINQCEALGESDSQLDELGLPPESKIVEEAKAAFTQMADWLSTELGPKSPHDDAVGRERYELFAELFHGRNVDLDEGYAWAQEELKRTVDKQKQIARKLYDDDSVAAAYRHLNQDERYTIHGTDNLLAWMNSVNEDVANVFPIPEGMPPVECAIDRAGSGGIFYTPPSDDMIRPGTMWWSVPEGQETFHTWQELTTVFHEGIPGHHLQHAYALLNRGELNFWRRSVCWNSAHGEGWALYAEHLMDGYREDLGYRMGLLDSMRLRLARVMVDIGVHLKKTTPEGTGVWDAQYAKAFLRDNTAMAEANLAFELDRYMGWPGQAPSYALGFKDWIDLRDQALSRGMTQDEFHTKALSLGSMPMDILAHAILH